MNLQEQISRIKGMMGVINETNNPKVESKLKESIISNLNKLRKKIPPQKVEIINTSEIIDNMQSYLIEQIPKVLEEIKKGQGGVQFTYLVYREIIKNLNEQLKKIGTVKKFAIRQLAPTEKEYIEMVKNLDIDVYIQTFANLIDFGFSIGWMDEMQPNIDNLNKFSKQSNEWVYKNAKLIKNEIIKIISDFLYR